MRRVYVKLAILALLAMLFAGCGKTEGLQDGYYTAQASEYSHGWK